MVVVVAGYQLFFPEGSAVEIAMPEMATAGRLGRS